MVLVVPHPGDGAAVQAAAGVSAYQRGEHHEDQQKEHQCRQREAP